MGHIIVYVGISCNARVYMYHVLINSSQYDVHYLAQNKPALVQNIALPQQPTGDQASNKLRNLPPLESETLRNLRNQVRQTQRKNKIAEKNIKTLEQEAVQIAGLFAGLSSRLIGLESSATHARSRSPYNGRIQVRFLHYSSSWHSRSIPCSFRYPV